MKIIFAGGGTAGHVEPALAIARLWREKNPNDNLEFIGTSTGLENQLVPAADFQLHHIPKVVLPRKISIAALGSPIAFLKALAAARRIIKGADLLIGFGGYVSAPAYLAAKSLGIAFVIHEANAKPGFANRLGAHLTKNVAVAQAVENGALSRALISGIPLRTDVAKAFIDSKADWPKARAHAKSKLGFSPTSPLVLAFFGSQGSVALNAVIEKSIPTLLANGNQLLHAVGKLNPLPKAQERYKSVAYIEDMATAYLAADLIISRSGAISCSEINALGRYSLFIPLPIGNGEQRYNANQVIAQGRGEIIDQQLFSPTWIASNLNRLLAESNASSIAGSDSDLSASEKIVNFMEFALNGKRD
jgi:UDP-N-acetylglucosamine--N-acetylmuramyl-(pentapeptide) pyrophosphoryl-undecaprenol N-acetylglucosamine transferase